MVTKPLIRNHLRVLSGFSDWQRSTPIVTLSRWVEFDLEHPQLYRFMERDTVSGVEVTQFFYRLGEGDFPHILLNTAGVYLERFSSLQALQFHACCLLGYDRLGAQLTNESIQ